MRARQEWENTDRRLSEMDQQQGRIVELRFFAGLTIEDISEVVGVSSATVKRDWITARAWLHSRQRRGFGMNSQH
jgi:DNA-directed RNA polymerase specialized sigma24 family protein